MNPTPLDQRLLEHVRSAGLFPKPGLALLAVSGGPDSVALLDLLHRLAPEIPVTLAVVHADHGIQPDSGAVADQVRLLGEGYRVPVHVERLALGAGASETRARRARYAALRAVQRRVGARYLLTAHQADDQIETVLYRVLKGSGIAGLAAIQPVGPNGLVRPLLPFRRAELEGWLAARFPDPGSPVPIHRDPSNADPRHDRSWIRVRVLPLLRERFGASLDQRLLDLAAHARREQDAWAGALAALPELEVRPADAGVAARLAVLRGEDPALAEALLRALGRAAGCRMGPRRSAALLRFLVNARSGRSLELGQGFVAEVAFDRLRLRRVVRARTPDPAELGDGREGRFTWGAFRIVWRTGRATPIKRAGWATWLAPGHGLVRAARAGDRVLPLGAPGHRPVRRLLMEARVPRAARGAYPVVLWGSELAWVPGVCRAQVAVPQPGSAAVRLEVRRLGSRVGVPERVG
jgi:tRNA(Ile)-lysidine synthetase-like protein